jgi:hypothetical protein
MITIYLESLLKAIDALQAEKVTPRTITALLALEHLLDQARVLYAERVPAAEQTIDMRDLHRILNALRTFIAHALKALPTEELESILRYRVLEAQSSWWHMLKK